VNISEFIWECIERIQLLEKGNKIQQTGLSSLPLGIFFVGVHFQEFKIAKNTKTGYQIVVLFKKKMLLIKP